MAKTRTIQLCNWLVPVATDILLGKGDEPHCFFPNFARPLYFFFSSVSCHLQKSILLDETSEWFYNLVCNFFTSKHYPSGCRPRWENLDRGQYPFQPIKFMNLVVPSPFETKPYNQVAYYNSSVAQDKSVHSNVVNLVISFKPLHFVLFLLTETWTWQ